MVLRTMTLILMSMTKMIATKKKFKYLLALPLLGVSLLQLAAVAPATKTNQV